MAPKNEMPGNLLQIRSGGLDPCNDRIQIDYTIDTRKNKADFDRVPHSLLLQSPRPYVRIFLFFEKTCRTFLPSGEKFSTITKYGFWWERRLI